MRLRITDLQTGVVEFVEGEDAIVDELLSPAARGAYQDVDSLIERIKSVGQYDTDRYSYSFVE